MAESENSETYAGMFAEYLGEQTWIGPAEKPFVFHIRKLCSILDRQIEEKGEATGTLASAYLQALSRLDKRRPGAAGGDDPAQTSIFDELD